MTNFVSRRKVTHTGLDAKKLDRNNLIAICLCVWFALAIACFTWFGLQNSHFASQLRQSKNNIKTTIATSEAKIRVAYDASDFEEVVFAFRELSATTLQNTKTLPTAPNLVSLRVGADYEHNMRQQLQRTGKNYADKLTEVADFITYQSVIAQRLQVLSLKDASGYDKTIELADAWHEATRTTQDEQKPPSIANIIATLVQKMETTEMLTRNMAELYRKNDIADFNTKHAALVSTTTEMKTLSVQITAIGILLGSELAASAQKLQQNL